VTGLAPPVTAAVLGLAWFAASNALLSILAMVAAHLFSERLAANAWRAWRLLVLRLAPAFVSAAVAAALFIPAHLSLEPVRTDERIGIVAMAFAAAGLLLLMVSVSRAVSGANRALRLARITPRRELRHGAVRLLEVPGLGGVALAGIFRPRILIGTRTRRVLTSAELDLAVAHEQAHQRAGDNLVRALMHSAPDFLGWCPQARRLERLWEAEAECLADAAAARGNPVLATRLASALIKVARLASADRSWSAGLSTFHHPALLESRVRLLVSDARVPAASASYLRAAAAASLAAVWAAWVAGVPQLLHRVTETFVARLP
jgi:beta-lactamase regulating signal transducer with metallopeptidase domain